jgi:hypothetical protein
MKIIRWLSSLFGTTPSSLPNEPSASNALLDPVYGVIVNPATGLPMVGGIYGLDTGGNPYGYRGGRYDTSIPDEKIHDGVKGIASVLSASAPSNPDSDSDVAADVASHSFTSSCWDHDSWDDINPATGLPMMVGGLDTAGNPYGCSSSWDDFT